MFARPPSRSMDTEHKEYVEYIQEKYFRTGLYTHLFVDMQDGDGALGNGVLYVKWIFTFQDLGSTHVLSREPAVVSIDPRTCDVLVDGIPHPDIEHAERAIFAGHYGQYVRELYEFEGITNV